MKPMYWLLAVTAALALALSGCGTAGDDGAQGPPGPPGPPGSATSSYQDTLQVTVTGVTIASPPVVNFVVADQNGLPVTTLGLSNIRFTLAKLAPNADGVGYNWVSYINQEEDPTTTPPGWPSVTPPAYSPGTTTIQATYESNVGTLVHKGSGAYTYTFATDVKNVTSPVAVTYDGSLTHRLGMQFSGGGLPASNPTYDFVPNGGAVSTKRNIVQTASCNECHNKLAIHGGGRIEVKFCVTCHNPGTTDAQSGNTVDLKSMVHKLHRGQDLVAVTSADPSAPGEYAIWGYRNSKHDYSGLAYPNDLRRCTKCHTAADSATPQGDNWKNVPTKEACATCHDNIYFTSAAPAAWMTAHSGGVGPTYADNNLSCAGCHPATGSWTPGSAPAPVETVHQIPAEVAAANFQYNITSATYDGTNVIVQFTVTNPTDGTYWRLPTSPTEPTLADPELDPITAGGAGNAARLALLIGWDTGDYSNDGASLASIGAPSSPGQPVSVNVLDGTSAVESEPVAGQYTYTVTVDVSATNIGGSAVVALEGHPAWSTDGGTTYTLRVPVKSAVDYLAVTDTSAAQRRQVVDITAKCDNCHGSLSMHGNNRTDEGQVCVICHNPFATDIGRRPIAGADPFSVDVAATPDKKREESIDFKRMVHAIHGAAKREASLPTDPYGQPITIYGYMSSVHTFDTTAVHFPGRLNDCTACHVGSSYQLPISDEIWGTTVDTSTPDNQTGAFVADLDPLNDLKISPTAAVCSACHASESAAGHMQTQGGAVGVSLSGTVAGGGPITRPTAATQATLDSGVIESCDTCHGPGRLVDIAVMHQLQ